MDKEEDKDKDGGKGQIEVTLFHFSTKFNYFLQNQ